jgi:hypothetical protein
MPAYEMQMPFWIDTDGYTDRDREMFVCGVEFEMLRQELQMPRPVDRTIHAENESRAKLMAARFGRHCKIEASETEGWSYFSSP